jgi:hypothetical protein
MVVVLPLAPTTSSLRRGQCFPAKMNIVRENSNFPKSACLTYPRQHLLGQAVAEVEVRYWQVGGEERLERLLGQREHIHHEVHAWRVVDQGL